MNWDHVRFFLAVAEHGTVSGAAVALGVSHATVLRNVARLEAVLDTRLFDHAQSGYRLTLTGQDILTEVRQMAECADALVKKLQDRDRLAAGRLTLAMPDSSLVNLLPVVSRFCTEYPQIEVAMVDDTGNNEADVLLRVTDQPPEQLIGRQLARLDFAIFAKPDVVPPSADKCRWIIWQNRLSNDEAVSRQERWLRRITPEPAVVLNAESHARAVEAVRSGLGAALLVDRGADMDLTRLAFPHRPVTQGLWMLTSAGYRGSARVSAFMQFVAENLQKKPS
ncbi:MAG: LysR family transcriptional regulator [Proteobacteria bacterium]|nr:LysR family transcriptional regulator [Pseudomonadota bacterium]